MTSFRVPVSLLPPVVLRPGAQQQARAGTGTTHPVA